MPNIKMPEEYEDDKGNRYRPVAYDRLDFRMHYVDPDSNFVCQWNCNDGLGKSRSKYIIVEKIEWKPKRGEEYFYYDYYQGIFSPTVNLEYANDKFNIENGNYINTSTYKSLSDDQIDCLKGKIIKEVKKAIGGALKEYR